MMVNIINEIYSIIEMDTKTNTDFFIIENVNVISHILSFIFDFKDILSLKSCNQLLRKIVNRMLIKYYQTHRNNIQKWMVLANKLRDNDFDIDYIESILNSKTRSKIDISINLHNKFSDKNHDCILCNDYDKIHLDDSKLKFNNSKYNCTSMGHINCEHLYRINRDSDKLDNDEKDFLSKFKTRFIDDHLTMFCNNHNKDGHADCKDCVIILSTNKYRYGFHHHLIINNLSNVANISFPQHIEYLAIYFEKMIIDKMILMFGEYL